MAWQLIYTSAPRLMEAGRSGFGTVARHRELSPLLVSAVERVSQFSRQPGLDVARVIFSHRIIPVSGSRYHVLSCIRDAGADYTGRTNHIAHHLIVDAREVAQAGANAPMPAEVLLGMPWRDSWDEPPRSLGAEEEVALTQFRRQTGPQNAAWQHATGSASNAWLLANGPASRGTYIVTPPSADLRYLYAESMRLATDRAWQTSCTTSLQPSDESSDFRWIGLEADSSLRPSPDNAGRPVLDLTEPHRLPEPEILYAAAPAPVQAVFDSPVVEQAVPPVFVPAEVEVHHREVDFVPTAQVTTAPEAVATPQRVSIPMVSATTVKPMRPNGKSVPPPREYGSVPAKARRKGMSPLTAVVVTVAALMTVAGGAYMCLRPYLDTILLRNKIAADLHDGRYFSKEAAKEVSEFIVPQRNGEIYRKEDLDSILKLSRGLLDARLNELRAGEMKGDEQRLDALIKWQSAPTRLAELKSHLNKVKEMLAWSPKFESVKDAGQQYDEFIAGVDGAFAAGPPYDVVRTKLIQDGLDKTWTVILGKLKDSLPPANPVSDFKEAIEHLKSGQTGSVQNDGIAVENIVTLWAAVGNPDALRNREEIKKRLDADSEKNLPQWLLTRARQVIPASGVAPRDTMAIGNPGPAAKGGGTLPQTLPAPLPIYLVTSVEGLKDIKLVELAPNLEFELWSPIETKLTSLIASGEEPNRNLRRSLNENELFQIDAVQMKLVPTTAANAMDSSFAIVAKRVPAGEVFRIWVAMDGKKPLLGKHQDSIRRDGDILRLQTSELRLPGTLKAQLRLQLPADCIGLPGMPNSISLGDDQSGKLEPLTAGVRNEIARIKAELSKIDDKLNGRVGDQAFQARKASFLFNAKVHLDPSLEGAAPARQIGGCIVAAFKSETGLAETLFAEGKKLSEDKPIPEQLAQLRTVRTECAKLFQSLTDEHASLRAEKEKTRTKNDALDLKLQNVANTKAKLQPMLSELTTLITLVEAPQVRGNQDQIAALQTDLHNQLKKLNANPLHSGELPVGIYKLLAMPGGKEVTVMEIEVRPAK